jgi:hypothetical protein
MAKAPTPWGVDKAQMISSRNTAQRYIDKY